MNFLHHIPGVGEAIANMTIAQEEATKSYQVMKKDTIDAINKLKELNERKKDPGYVPEGFSVSSKNDRELCDTIQFTQGILSLIDQGRTLPSSIEGPETVNYKDFKKIVDESISNCQTGGKFYKLKVKSKNKTRNSKKYKKYKGKKFRKSKRLGK